MKKSFWDQVNNVVAALLLLMILSVVLAMVVAIWEAVL